MKKYNSIQMNMILNLIRTVFSTIFPLIIFKYITYVLTPDTIGSINYSNSIVQYFSVLAGLGVSTYATRECSRVRDDKFKFEKIGNELFTISVAATLFSYILLIMVCFLINDLVNYRIIILIQSLSIFLNVIGVDWINIVQEDYKYITIRTIVIQLISLLLIFMLVKENSDYLYYVIITVLATFFTNVMNLFYVRRYISLRLIFNGGLIKHLKPIFIIFFMNIQISLYVNSDITILGVYKGDFDVSIYSIAVKVYSTIKVLLAAVTSVAVPRLSYEYNNDKNLYLSNLTLVLQVLIFFSLPTVAAVLFIPEMFIDIVSNNIYYAAIVDLQVFALAIVPTLLSTILNNNVLLVKGMESKILISTTISSCFNIIFNIILIPYFGHLAAAITTLLSELIVIIMCFYYSKDVIKELNYKSILVCSIKSFIGAIFISILLLILRIVISNRMLFYFVSIFLSVILYFFVQLFLNNSTINYFINRKRGETKI